MSESAITQYAQSLKEVQQTVTALAEKYELKEEHTQSACCYRLLVELGDNTRLKKLAIELMESANEKRNLNKDDTEAFLSAAQDGYRFAQQTTDPDFIGQIGRRLGWFLVRAGNSKKDGESAEHYADAEALFNKYGALNWNDKCSYVHVLRERINTLSSEEQFKLNELVSQCAEHMEEVPNYDLLICCTMAEICCRGVGRKRDDDEGHKWAVEFDKRAGNTSMATEYFKKKLLGGYKCVYEPWIKG
ncbi:MAG: hypothetical protein II784_01335 [Oscillospiraceae bacterium]|nr:hypothetical protein [Oscillospiraceae bacterium]MBR6428274.1 hypothetical protein [Clostridia bacterium]